VVIGLVTLPQYAITWDEPENFSAGRRTLSFYLAFDPGSLAGSPPKLGRALPFRDDMLLERYPPFASGIASFLSLLLSEKTHILHPVAAHHVGVVLLSAAGVAAAFLIAFGFTGSTGAGLVASLALGFHPQYFAHAHNNIKDAPGAAMAALGLLSMMMVLKRKTPGAVIAAGIVIGLAAATKFHGILLVPIGALAVTYAHPKRPVRLALYFAFCMAAFLAAWPWIGLDPVVHAGKIVRYVSEVGRGMPIVFRGEFYQAGVTAPWYYGPATLILTTPIPLLVLTLLGVIGVCVKYIRPALRIGVLLFFLWLGIFLIRMMLPGQVVYNAARQGMEAYVGFAVLAGIGWHTAVNVGKARAIRFWIILGVVVHLLWIHITLHPYQATYYNRLAGTFREASERFEFDYWGFSLGEMVTWINQNRGDTGSIDTNWVGMDRSFFPGNTHRVVSFDNDAAYVILPHANNFFEGAVRYWKERGTLLYTVARNGADIGYIFVTGK